MLSPAVAPTASLSMADDMRGVITSLLPLIEEHAVANERARRILPEVADALRPTGVFRMYVPGVYDGPEIDPLTGIDIVAALSEADAATGWCVSIAAMTSHIAGVLEPHWAREVFGDRESIACGAFAPNGKARAVAGGHRIDGRWQWGSGSQLSSWLTGGVITDEGQFHLMLLPTPEVEILDTWYSMGLQGTGSHDFVATDVFVPTGRSVHMGHAQPMVDASITRLSLFVLFSGGVASVLIGIARRAIRELTDLATTKKPAQSSKTLAMSSQVQIDIAKAEAIVRSSYAYLVDEVGAAWEVVERGDRLEVEHRLRARLAASHVGLECCRAVDLAYNAGGGSSVFATSPLQRCFRDAHTASAHIMVSSRAFETMGRHRFGQEIDLSNL